MRLLTGTRLGAYEILAPLGAGGMGEVYRARDTRLRRDVAMKVLPAEVAADPDRIARFEREARAVAALNHPNIVMIHSIEDVDGIRFLTMELVDGQSLDRHIVQGGLPVARVVELGFALADAVVAAHARGVVHRDLKPANIIVTPEGRLKILDFGLASLTAPPPGSQALTQTAPITPAGEVLGTAPYMAPEQVRGRPADARSDLFAMGVILYELVTGRRPFLGATAAEVAAAILHETPPRLRTLRPEAPPDLERIIERCLDKDPERRVQTAKDVRNEFERALHDPSPRNAGSAEPVAPGKPEMPSIAVLPFENRSHDEEDEYFADGMTEDVIAQLCKVRTLKVISRSSVMRFKGHRESLKEIASQLRVADVLEGSVRRQGERVRIVAELVDPVSDQTLWAETYDRKLTDIFEIQSEVALHIAQALKAELTSGERERIRREPTRDIVAYELYLRGRQNVLRFDVSGMLASIGYFERAIERDPEFAPPYAELATAYTEIAEQGAQTHEHVGALALDAAEKALALDPELADAHFAQAYALSVFKMDWAGAEAGYRRALELSPGNAFVYDYYGRMCAGLGRYDEAIAMHERAYELDPLVSRADLATSLMRAGRNDEAVRLAQQTVGVDPQYARGRATLGWALFRQGRVREGVAEMERATELAADETLWSGQLGEMYAMAGETGKAREVLRRLEDPSRPEPVSPYHLAYVYTGLGDAERAIDCLERAYQSRTGSVYSIKGSFLLAPLRQHPRFVALLDRMGVR